MEALEGVKDGHFSLTFSQIFEFVITSPVAGRLGSGLPGRMLLLAKNIGVRG